MTAVAFAFDSLAVTHKARSGVAARAFAALSVTHKARSGAAARAIDITEALKVARSNAAYPVGVLAVSHNPRHSGYIAGTLDGIVTIAGQPAQRGIWCYEVTSASMTAVAQVWSLPNGHYLVPFLDKDKKHLIIGRDYEARYEPVAYDNINVATDLDSEGLSTLWQQLQAA